MYSLDAFRAGESPRDIATRREMTEATIIGHLARCYVAGEDIDLASLIPTAAENWVAEAHTALPEAEGNKDIVEWVNNKYGSGAIGYGTLRVLEALAKRAAVS